MDWYHRAITIKNINIPRPIIDNAIPPIANPLFVDFKPIFPQINPRRAAGKLTRNNQKFKYIVITGITLIIPQINEIMAIIFLLDLVYRLFIS